MTCAKTKVTCELITADGVSFMGENWCENPQAACPREEGEGYEKCKTICKQFGHAEIDALRKAGDKAVGSRAFINGHTYACQSCQEALYGASVVSISVGI